MGPLCQCSWNMARGVAPDRWLWKYCVIFLRCHQPVDHAVPIIVQKYSFMRWLRDP